MKISENREYTLQLTDEEWGLVKLALRHLGGQVPFATFSRNTTDRVQKLSDQMIDWDSE